MEKLKEERERESSQDENWWAELSLKFNIWKNQFSHQVSSILGIDPSSRIAAFTDSSTSPKTKSDSGEHDLWILGQKYSSSDELLQFWTHYRSLIWITYSTHFPKIDSSHFTTDVGWGCMIRAGQSMLATCLLCHFFDRDWRKGSVYMKDNHKVYINVCAWKVY